MLNLIIRLFFQTIIVFACSFSFAAISPTFTYSVYTPYGTGTSDTAEVACASVRLGSAAAYGYCTLGPGPGEGNGYQIFKTAICPENSSLDSGICVCSAPSIESNGACTVPPNSPSLDLKKCQDASEVNNSTLGIPYEEVTVNGSVSSNTSICIGTTGMSSNAVGCTVNFNLDIGYTKPDGTKVSRGTIDTQNGYATLPCSLTTIDPTKPPKAEVAKCPSGQQTGQVNGVDVCKPIGPSVAVKTTETTTVNKDNVVTTNTDITECLSEKCTTTSIIKSIAGSGAETFSTSTKTESKSFFCQIKPSSAQCSGASVSASGPSGGEASDGDCVAGSDKLKCSEFGQPGTADETSNTNIALTFNRESGFGASDGVCPSPRVLNIPGGRTISMSFDMYCDFARGMRPFIIGFALLSAAGMVVFGATRKG